MSSGYKLRRSESPGRSAKRRSSIASANSDIDQVLNVSTIEVDNMKLEAENPLLSVHSMVESKQVQARGLRRKLKVKKTKQYIT